MPFTFTRPASIGASALRREGAAPARARNACRRTTKAPAVLAEPCGGSQPFAHAGELFLRHERIDGREVIRGGGAGGRQELVCHAEECG